MKEAVYGMISEKIKSNKFLHPIARNTKKIFLKIWILLQRLFVPRRKCEIERYKGIHKGERCFIVATGPSLTMADLSKIKNEYSFSMNSIINLYDKTDYRPTYYLIQDRVVERRLRKKLLNVKHKKSFMGVGDFKGFSGAIYSRQAKRYKGIFDFYNLKIIYNIYDLCYPTNNKQLDPRFSFDCADGVYCGYTVAYSAIQMAFYMGFSEIYLLGCDCNMAGHVDDSDRNDEGINMPVEEHIHSYKVAKKIADEEGVKIFNATRGGMLEVFPRVDLDSLFKKGQ